IRGRCDLPCRPFGLFSPVRRDPRRALLAGDLDDAVVETLRGRVDRVLELPRDQAAGAPEERLGPPVGLFPQPVGGLLTYRSHAVLELERAGLASRVDLPLDRPLEALDLAPFELGEGDLDAGVSFALGPVDLLVHGVLVLPQSLVQLVDRASPVV